MRIIFLTQEEPIFLPKSFSYLLPKILDKHEVVGVVIMSPSPFGKAESLFGKVLRTYRVFGFKYLVRYAVIMLFKKISGNTVEKIFSRHGIVKVNIKGSVNSDESIKTLEQLRPDLYVSIAANQIFKSKFLASSTHGCLNLHSSLLPKYRGLLPSFWVLKHGEIESGVSVFLVDEGIDSGPILVQKKLSIVNLTQEQLISSSKILGMDAISEAVDMISAGGYTLIENSKEDSTYFTFPTKEDVKIFLEKGKKFY